MLTAFSSLYDSVVSFHALLKLYCGQWHSWLERVITLVFGGINDYILITVDNKLLRRLHVVIRGTGCAYAKLMYSFCFVPVSLECVWPYAFLLHLPLYITQCLLKQKDLRAFTCFVSIYLPNLLALEPLVLRFAGVWGIVNTWLGLTFTRRNERIWDVVTVSIEIRSFSKFLISISWVWSE